MNLPLVDLQKKYQRRYGMFVRLVQDQQEAEDTGEITLTNTEVTQMRTWLKALNSLDEYH